MAQLAVKFGQFNCLMLIIYPSEKRKHVPTSSHGHQHSISELKLIFLNELMLTSVNSGQSGDYRPSTGSSIMSGLHPPLPQCIGWSTISF